MQTPIYWCPYTLIPKRPLNAVASGAEPRVGALLRVGEGFGAMHPWPELGDAPLQDHLQSLSLRKPTLMAQQALECCRLDGQARLAGGSLFQGLTVPRSHATLTQWPNREKLAELSAQGFTHVKVKANGKDPNVVNQLLQLAQTLTQFQMQLRVDFNATLPAENAAEAMTMLAPAAEVIDFLEDPTPYAEGLWTSLSTAHPVPLAVDWYTGTVPAAAAQVRVFKPACQPVQAVPQARRIITSAMDHPLGQAYAAYIAARELPPDEPCGLLTHRLYEANAFSESMIDQAPHFPRLPGHGLGFDELLEKQNWQPLVD